MWRKFILPAACLLALSVLAVSCGQADNTNTGEQQPVPEQAEGQEIKTTPDGIKYIVEPGKVISGGPPMDGIPSIDNPVFDSVEEADEWIEDNELIIALTHKGETRVYPLQIMVWHEIVNDTIAGDPLLITY